jgi:hypothetical protein
MVQAELGKRAMGARIVDRYNQGLIHLKYRLIVLSK